MTDILRLTLIVLLLTVTLAAYFLVIGALFTNRVAKTQTSLNLTPWTFLRFGHGQLFLLRLDRLRHAFAC